MRRSAEIRRDLEALRVLDNAVCRCRNIETVAALLQSCDPRWTGGVMERATLASLGILISVETKRLSDLIKELGALVAKRSGRKR